MDNLHGMPGHLIRRAQQASSAIFAEECNRFDVTPVQFAILTAVGGNPDVDATRLSHLVAFDRSTLGDVLERMEAKDWILRTTTPTDRRVKLLRLTREGETLLKRIRPAVRRVQERLLAPLAPADRTTLIRLLAELALTHNDVLPAPMRALSQA